MLSWISFLDLFWHLFSAKIISLHCCADYHQSRELQDAFHERHESLLPPLSGNSTRLLLRLKTSLPTSVNVSILQQFHSNQIIFKPVHSLQKQTHSTSKPILTKNAFVVVFYSHKRVGELLFTCWVGHLTHWLRIFFIYEIWFLRALP